ncbi:PAS domain S-box protein [Desulfoluna sp.]|uniref:PAS domain S-box protein n=1 Tax=Desulfoluna sp. TaxID=2045199 RepID=UPI00262B16A6|nr:PAS domain S-box protein [Desulfoluna sp.]
MIRFRSSMSVQLTVTLSMALLLFAVVFALFTTRHVQMFGDDFSARALRTLRHRVELNLADRVRERALHYDHFFEKIAKNSALLAEKARDSLFVESPSSSLLESMTALEGAPSGVFMGPLDTPVFTMRLSDGEPSPSGITPEGLSCLVPYLEVLGQASEPTVAAYLTTMNGFFLYYPNRVSREAFSGLTLETLKKRGWFSAATLDKNPSQGTVWTPMYADTFGHGMVATAATPIVSPEGVFKGMVGIDLSFQRLFEPFFDEDETSLDVDGMFWFLLDNKGVPLLFSEDVLAFFGLTGSVKEGQGLLTSSHAEVRQYTHRLLNLDKGVGRLALGQGNWIVSHHVLSSMGWVLGVVVPEEALFAGLKGTQSKHRQTTRRMGWDIVAGAIVFISLILGLFYCALRERLVRPLQMLAYQAKRVSEGYLEIETVSLKGQDEMARLAASFDQMIASLREGRDFQERTTDYLEAMVRSRTQALDEKAEELHSALTELTTIFSNSMVGIMLLRGGRRLWKANDRMARILGYDCPEEMEGLSMRELHLSEEMFLRYGSRHYDALVHGECMQIDYQLKRRDGTPVWCTLSGKAVDDSVPPDLDKGVIWVVDEITQRKESEQAIRESEERFREMAELLPCIVCEVDFSLRVTYVNSLGLKVFNIAPEDFHKPGIVLQAFHPDDRQRVVGRVEISLGGGEVEPTEYRMIPVGGKEMTVLFHSAPIVKNSAVVGLRASLTDVTEYRALQETLLKQRKLELIGSLTGGLAHDFNNMLAVMLGRVELAVLSLSEGSPAQEHLVIMEETLGRARDLMARLITLSTQGEDVERSVSLQVVLRRCVDEVGGASEGVFLDLSAAVPQMPVVSSQMEQAIASVLTNAREASDGKGGVWVTCRCLEKGSQGHTALTEASVVEIAFRDKGRGIAEEHLPHIFDPYYTTKERSTRKGMGLGLAVTHAVVARHGGTVAVDSRPGWGTTVYICLPLPGGDTRG